MFTIELTVNERMLLIFALGQVHGMPAVVSDHNAPPATAIELARRLVDLPGATPAPAPAAVKQPIAAALDAKGGFPLTIRPHAITKTGTGDKERLVVEWLTEDNNPEVRARKNVTKRASCWSSERAIWPLVLAKVKQEATFLMKEKNGYLNIVGVQ